MKKVHKNQVEVANESFSKGNWSNAIENYKKCIEKDKGNYVYYRNIGVAYFAQKQYKNAINWFEEALKLGASSPCIFCKLVTSCLYSKEYDRAIFYIDQELKLEKDCPYLWRKLGLALEKSGNISKAKDAYKKALKLFIESGDKAAAGLVRKKLSKLQNPSIYNDGKDDEFGMFPSCPGNCY